MTKPARTIPCKRLIVSVVLPAFILSLCPADKKKDTDSTVPAAKPIDRYALVSRHNPVIRKPDPLSPLSVGNGEFAFTADITGLQTFP
ncbi:MAG: hypothetical protein ACYTBJ_15960, partial [Planctomycetota bacterium]